MFRKRFDGLNHNSGLALLARSNVIDDTLSSSSHCDRSLLDRGNPNHRIIFRRCYRTAEERRRHRYRGSENGELSRKVFVSSFDISVAWSALSLPSRFFTSSTDDEQTEKASSDDRENWGEEKSAAAFRTRCLFVSLIFLYIQDFTRFRT